MPGANNGTGHPLTFRCAKCKVGRDYRNSDPAGTNWECTGAAKGDLDQLLVELKYVRVSRHIKAQYRCLDCGHVGWSGHQMVLTMLREDRGLA